MSKRTPQPKVQLVLCFKLTDGSIVVVVGVLIFVRLQGTRWCTVTVNKVITVCPHLTNRGYVSARVDKQ